MLANLTMRIQLLIAVLFLWSIASYAQTSAVSWCPPGAAWTYSFRLFSSYGDVRVRYLRDTSIAGRTCQLLRQQIVSKDLMNPAGATLTRTMPYLVTAADADKVYFWANNQFYTLYDFSALPGASWLLVASSNLGYFCTQPVRAVVDSAGQQQFAGQSRRWLRLHLELVGPPAQQQGLSGMSGRIYEGIGPTIGYMLPQGRYANCGGTDPEHADNLLCFQANGLAPVYGGPTAACTVLATNGQQAAVNFAVFPNPSAGELIFQLPVQAQNAQVFIRNTAGRCVWRGAVPASGRLNLRHLPRGLYIATLQEQSRVIARRFLLE